MPICPHGKYPALCHEEECKPKPDTILLKHILEGLMEDDASPLLMPKIDKEDLDTSE